jgi:hypothetical protein
MNSVTYQLSAADQARAAAFAQQIQQDASPADRQRIARYGMDVFQQVKPSLEEEMRFLTTLYMADIPGLVEFMEPLITCHSNDRCAAFEQAIALNVHLLATRQPLPPAVQNV